MTDIDVADERIPAPEESGSTAIPQDQDVAEGPGPDDGAAPDLDAYERGEGPDDPEPADDDDALAPELGGEG